MPQAALISMLGEIMEFKVTGDETGGSFYGIDGKFSFLLGDRTIEARPGFFCRVPKGTTKTSPPKREGTPAGFEKFWVEIADPVANSAGSSGPSSPETIARLMSLALKYGLEVKGP